VSPGRGRGRRGHACGPEPPTRAPRRAIDRCRPGSHTPSVHLATVDDTWCPPSSTTTEPSTSVPDTQSVLKRTSPQWVHHRPARDPVMGTSARTTGMVGRGPDSGMGRAFRPAAADGVTEEWSADHRPRTRLKMKNATATMTRITRMVHNIVSSVPCLSQAKESGVQGRLRIPTPSPMQRGPASRLPPTPTCV
jgi:hypothetical protein